MAFGWGVHGPPAPPIPTPMASARHAEACCGTLLKLLVKDKLLHSEKVSVNAELRSLKRKKRGTEVQRFERGDEDVTE